MALEIKYSQVVGCLKNCNMISTLKKINFLITKRQRKGLVILTLLLFIGMILEVFRLGILIPALSILLDPKMIETNSRLEIENAKNIISSEQYSQICNDFRKTLNKNPSIKNAMKLKI